MSVPVLSPEDVRRALAGLPRLSLAHLPTPLDEAPRFAERIGVGRVLIKPGPPGPAWRWGGRSWACRGRCGCWPPSAGRGTPGRRWPLWPAARPRSWGCRTA
jgi:hypothetical protein